jgi:two-component system, NtrC family, nitrogen regulation sensor histidine kinase NtrY
MPGKSDSSPAGAMSPEVRRRRREGWIILATALAVVGFALFEARLPQSANTSPGLDIVLVALVNLNLILLVLLVFLVGRNIIKLIFERRRRILGSHLRTRLVTAFVLIALFPATLLFVIAHVFLGNSVERWFNGQVEHSLEGSLEVAHSYYQDLAGTSLGFARHVAAEVAGEGLLEPGRRTALRSLLENRRSEYQLDLLEVLPAHGRAVARSRQPGLPSGSGTRPGLDVVHRAIRGEGATAVDPVGKADMIRAAAPIMLDGRPAGVVVVGAFVPQSVVKRREEIDRAFGEYLRLKIQRRPIQTAYTITLALVSLVVLFSATWAGFYLARGITVPIQRLAEGTRAVAQGDLDHHIAGAGEDEIGTLVGAFNSMTADLKTSRTELDERRRYLETLLGNIAAGVVSSDAEGHINTMNRAAESLLGFNCGDYLGRRVDEVFAGESFAELRQLAAQLRGAPQPTYAIAAGAAVRLVEPRAATGAPVERQLTLARPDGEEVVVLLTGTRLVDEAGRPQGVVLFLEDVPHLLRVQRMEAWREVARRIAHEIKNPLTPIQLSAQRLRRRYAAQLRDGGAVFDECTRTIVQQVEELKALVDEFSNFARMPSAPHVPQNLNRLVEEGLVLFREGHRDVDFHFEPAEDLPVLDLDREGIKRALINILDNAVAACATRRNGAVGERARIELRTAYDPRLDVARLEIADNGTGMTPEVKARLFEPYFSTKAEGTGLGLAIVSTIVADHNGFVRVRDNVPRGSRFILEFPARRQAAIAARARQGSYGRA